MKDLKPLAALLVLASSPAAAPAQTGPTFVVPAGCEAFLTVQSRQCIVSHYWTCPAADPEGTFWRVSLDADGPYYLSQSDEQYRWLRGFSLRSDGESTLVEPEPDPASLDELFETGTDTMDFTLRRRDGGVEYDRTYTGFDRLTGASVVIDGEELLLTEFAYRYNTEQGTNQASGNQFLSRDWRLFFGGIETVTLPDGQIVEEDRSPREFIEPGEDGFLTMLPAYDCGDTMSLLTWPELSQ
ncbi:MAG: hypothetical protein AAGA70_10740 [Pseudomonadota bacterium]